MVAGTSSSSSKMPIKGNTELPLSVNTVLSDYDLLFDILHRLPVLSLVLFKSVSKRWLRIITSPDFILRHRSSDSAKLNAPFGLLIPQINTKPNTIIEYYDFESFDNRIPSKRSIVFPFAPHRRVEILRSCNGLLLCSVYPNEFYVYNPTSKLFKMLPIESYAPTAKMAFHPTKSPHYKVIQPVRLQSFSTMQVRTYSSETGVWSVCGDQFPETCFQDFKEGVFWNDAFHWLNMFWNDALHFKLDIGNEKLILTEIEFPVTFDGKSHFQSKLFESRGCLLLLGIGHAHSQQLHAFEMKDDDSEWSVKFIVNLYDIIMPFGLLFWEKEKRILLW